MAIQPRFAQAILSGDKTIEFRKRRLAEDVDTVLIYESAPTQRIVGRFTIAQTVEGTPRTLWRDYGSVGGIPRVDFFTYYTGHDRAVGFVVADRERYQAAVALGELRSCPTVPQSFLYLPASTLQEIDNLQPLGRTGSITSLASRLLHVPGRLFASAAHRELHSTAQSQ